MVAAAAMLFLFLVVAAVVLNVGWWLRDKRDAQNDVDASVLAGAQELPDESTARAMAEAWAASNRVASGDLDCCVFEDLTGDGAADLIRATVEREPGLLAGNLLDIGIVTVTARAAAAKQRAVASCVPPWGLVPPNEALGPAGYWGLDPKAVFVFREEDFIQAGNRGALRLYGNGTPCYKAAIENACGTCTGGCANGPIWGGTTLYCDPMQSIGGGQNTCEPLRTVYGGDCHGGAPSNNCDATTYLDAVSNAKTGECIDRAVPVPIIDAFPKGNSDPVQILGLATFYIAGWDRMPKWGEADIDGDGVDEEGMVWGYFLQDAPVLPAWKIHWDYSDDPFAPIKIVLVE